MQNKVKNFGIVTNSVALRKALILWNVFVDYADDYFAGQKYKNVSVLKNMKQNQK